jgi:hypothetical protein
MPHEPGHEEEVVITDETSELLDEEEVTVVEQKEQRIFANTMYGFIEQYTKLPIFYFDIPVTAFSGGVLSTDKKLSQSDYFSLSEIINDYRFNQFMPRQFRDRYKLITGFGVSEENLEKEMASLVEDMHSYFKENDLFIYDIQDVDAAGSERQSINYNSKKTENGSPQLGAALFQADAVGTLKDVIDYFDGSIIPQIAAGSEEQAQAEAEEEELLQSKTIVNNAEQYGTSGLAWGYSTDSQGYVVNPQTGEKEVAPFLKGDEYYDFLDMSEADIFRLQKRMVQAGMNPPTVDEYGKWTEREARFMTVVFTKATDSESFRTDMANEMPMYETALNNMIADYQETDSFVQLLANTGYGVPTPNPTAGQIKSLLDAAAQAEGVVLSEADYVNFANVVINAMEKEAVMQREFDQSIPSDRDLILNTNFKDPRAAYGGDYGPSRMLEGSGLPLVLPSYEFLTQSKGTKPTPLKTSEILQDEIKVLKGRQIEGNQDLREIQYVTNMFEQAMGQLTYGGAEEA